MNNAQAALIAAAIQASRPTGNRWTEAEIHEAAEEHLEWLEKHS